jgi:hypothetical protein
MYRKVICLIAFVFMLCSLVTPPVGAELVGWWKLDETGGTVAADSSGQGHDGTIAGTPAWMPGLHGGAMQFSGDDSITLPAADMGMSSTVGSVSFWVNAGAPPGIGTIFWAGDNNTGGGFGPENEMTVHLEQAGTYWQGGEVSFWTPSSFLYSDPQKSVAGSAPINPILVSDNQWHHVAATWGGPDNNVKLYIDGALIHSAAYSPGGWAFTNMYLGRMANSSRFFNGLLDDVQLYNHAMNEAEIYTAMVGISVGAASNPNPADKATDVPRDTLLTWNPGAFPGTHDVYLSASYDDVNDASRTNPLNVLVGKAQDANTYDPPARFELGQTYYWRVDEVNDSPDATIFTGNVWSFTVEPLSYPVTGVTATASSQANADVGPERTVDGSGLNADDQHGTHAEDGWLSAKGPSAWIQFALGKTYSLDKMRVWNSNQGLESIFGFGAKNVQVEYSVDGTNWTVLGDYEFARAPGAATYVGDIFVDFGGAAAGYVKLTITSGWSPVFGQYGLSEVRFFYVPVAAQEPQPVSGATDLHPQVALSWRAGRLAASHDLYLGTDQQAVADGAIAPITTATPAYNAALNLDTAYYWKVVEVNQAEDPAAWAGDLWSFSTAHYVTIEDFESYTNNSPKRVFQTWIDGGGFSPDDFFPNGNPGNGTGSYAGYDPTQGDIMETALVYGGDQSLPLYYDGPVSEATRTFDAAQDWTGHGITTLVLFIRGDVNNVSAPVYLKINGTKVSGTTSTTEALWQQWSIPLASVSGVTFNNVKTLTIGVGNGASSASGTILVDEIRLYADPPAIAAPADPGMNGLAALYAFENNVQDSSGKGLHGTANGEPAYVSGPAGMGMALAFDGTNDYVDLPIGTLISSLNSATLAAWVNYPNIGNAWQRIFDFGTGATVYMFMSPDNGATNGLRFAITTAGNSGEQLVTCPSDFPSGWHHVAVVIDSDTMTLTLYQDGTLVDSAATTVLPKDLGVTTQNWLGRSQFAADPYLNGVLDDFRIFDRALSEGEVRYLTGDR